MKVTTGSRVCRDIPEAGGTGLYRSQTLPNQGAAVAELTRGGQNLDF